MKPNRATEDVVAKRMTSVKIIHLATHGLIVGDTSFTLGFPAGSMSFDLPPGTVVLTESARVAGVELKDKDIDEVLPFNGFLTAGKIMRMKLNAELVVLSACDTARGDGDQFQFSGLTSAFLAAGAKSVVSTLWSIPDGPTAALMIEFYENLAAGVKKSVALRLAILKTKKSHPNPVNWGAFSLFGLSN